MRFGIVTNTVNVPEVCSAGYDFLELRVAEATNPLEFSDEVFRAKADFLLQQPLSAECFCVFIPSDLRLVGPDANEMEFRMYAEIALARIKQLGAQILVWGSGSTRRIPEGFPQAEAWKQFKDRVTFVAARCKELDIRIALESLKRSETNFLNTINQCLDLADEVDQDVIGVVADNDHMSIEEFDLEQAIFRAGSRVLHVHLRDSNGRVPGSGGYDFHRFVQMLKKIDYQGRTSIEVYPNLDADLVAVRSNLQELFVGY